MTVTLVWVLMVNTPDEELVVESVPVHPAESPSLHRREVVARVLEEANRIVKLE
jgi:hypothetical protein